MKTLIEILRRSKGLEKGSLFWILMFSFAEGLSPLVTLVMTRFLLEELLGLRRVESLVIYLGILVGLHFFFSQLKAFSKERVELSYGRLGATYSELLARKAASLPLVVSESKENMDLFERAEYGIFIQGYLPILFSQLGGALVSVISGAIILGSQNYWILMGLLLTGMLILPGIRKITALEEDNARRSLPENRAFRFYVNLATDYRYNKDIQMFDGSAMMMDRAEESMDRILQINHEFFTKSGLCNGYMASVAELQTLLLFIYLGFLLFKGSIRPGDFLLLYGVGRQFSLSLQLFFAQFTQVVAQGLLVKPLFEYLDQKVVEDVCFLEDDVKEAMEQAKHGLHFRGEKVSFHYPTSERLILEDCDFEIEPGKITAIVGRNGAGKTTLMKLLCGFYRPTKGKIYLNGVDIERFPKEVYRKLLSPTFQDFSLPPLKISEILSCKKVDEDIEDREGLQAALEEVGMEKWVSSLKRGMNTYLSRHLYEDGVLSSGGQAQKLALARSLYRGGEMMLLDEPTAALDPRSEEEIFSMMLELVKDKTGLFISHRLSSTRHAHRILVMDQGKVTEEGSHEELMQRGGLYERMYKIQAQRYQ